MKNIPKTVCFFSQREISHKTKINEDTKI